MKLERYLERVGFDTTPRPDMETLSALIHLHLNNIPFENIDVQLGRTLTTSIDDAYTKIVEGGRGGWCFEMNGVFGWVLREIGFDVKRLAGGVNREHRGDMVLGNHLCLLVECEAPHLVDVGFGGSLLSPLPIALGSTDSAPYHITLQPADGGYWRFAETIGNDPFGYDFSDSEADETLLTQVCARLQSAPDSPFVQNLVAQIRHGETHISLRGRVVKRVSTTGVKKKILGSADELMETLRGVFALDIPEVAELWPTICARHEDLFGK